jgi:hypothetical protein
MAGSAQPRESKVKFKLSGPFAGVPIIVALYHLYASFHELLITFSKSQRYSLGADCQKELLLLLKQLLRAASTSDEKTKVEHLREASNNLDTLKLLLCLAKDCRCLSHQASQQLDSRLSEIGRMLGGWLKSVSSSP